MIKKRTEKKLQRFFSLLTVFSLVIQSGSGILSAKPVFAQELTPTPEVTQEPTPTYCPIEEPTPVPTQEVTPEPEPTSVPTSEPTAIPTEEVTPTVEPTIEPTQEVTLTAEPSVTEPTTEPTPLRPSTELGTSEGQAIPEVTVSVESASIEASPTEAPEGLALSLPKGELAVVIVEETQAELAPVDNACLITDKPDYAPKEKVLISGSGFVAGATYILVISSQDNPPVTHEAQVTANENGEFFYSYQLDGIYRPDYKVEAKDKDGNVVATTTFTDSRTTVSATLNGSSSVSVYPGASITAAVMATLTGGDDWHSTGWRIATSTGTYTCANTNDHDSNGTFTESFTINAPNTPGTYNAYFRISGSNSNCGNDTGTVLTLSNAVTVLAGPSWPTGWDLPSCYLDPTGESGIGNSDIDLDGPSSDHPAASYKWDSNYLYLRERIDGDPGNFDPRAWVVLVQNTAPKYQYLISLDGNAEKVKLIENTQGTAQPVSWSPIFNDPADGAVLWQGDTSVYASKVTDSSDYYVRFAVPISVLSGYSITSSSTLFFATSADANNFNKDHLDCYEAPSPTSTPTPTNTPTPTSTPTSTPTPTNTPTPAPVCGNGQEEQGETCDDGNTQSCDGCDTNCQIEPDSDQDTVSDTCDNCPGTPNPDQADADGDGIGDACDPQTCGNATPESPEQCDDGNTTDGDGCNSTCQFETGTLRVIKNVVDASETPIDPNNWSINVKQGGVNVTGSPQSGSGTGTVYTLLPGSYQVVEPNPGFADKYFQLSFSGDCARGTPDSPGYWTTANVTVVAGQEKICYLTNERPTSTVTVHKEVDSNGDGIFEGDDVAANTLGFRWGFHNGSINRDMGTSLIWGAAPSSVGQFVIHENTISGYHYVGYYISGWDAFSCSNPYQTSYPSLQPSLPSLTGDSFVLCNAVDIYCGDGIVNGTEQCDDDNNTDGDGCSSTCQFETGTLTVAKSVKEGPNQPYTDTAQSVSLFKWGVDQETPARDMLTSTDLSAGAHSVTENSVNGYQFDGWYYDGSEGKSCLNPEGATLPVNLNITAGQSKTIILCNSRLPYCGDGVINQTSEECDGTSGVTQGQNFCSTSCHLVPIYDGAHACPAGYVKSINSILTKSISATDADGESFNLTPGNKYLFEATGTFAPTSPAGWFADAGYTTNNNWSSLATQYGIHGTGNDYAAHALLADLGGGVGVVDWGNYNSGHIYSKYYEPTSSNVQFVIGDRYGDWFNTTFQNQAGMGDNSGSLTLNVYECVNYGSITAHKFADFDKSGVQEAGEPDVNYFQMSLYQGSGCSGSPTSQLDTENDGKAIFNNLIAGDYSIKETLPPPGDPGTGWWTNVTPLCQDVHVDPGQNKQINFANFRVQQLTVCKYNDINGDGHWQPEDNPLSGWTINLSGPESLSGVTGGDGCARIPVNIYGGYVITEILQPGWLQTFPPEPQTGYAEYSYSTGNQLYNFQLGIISGQKFNDLDGNGVKDGGESGLSGWTINLDKNANGSVDATTVTDANGNYVFTGLLAGTYRVREVLQTGWTQTSTDSADVVITSGSNVSGIDFGNFELGKIQGRKYEDLNNDGDRDSGESYLNSWTVRGYKKNGSTWDSIGELTTGHTGTQGQYQFSGLDKGTYYTCEVLESDWVQSDPQGTEGFANLSGVTDEAPRCRKAIIDSSGDVISGKHFGNIQYGTIDLGKCNDINGDGGECDGSEPMLPGWTLFLDENSNGVLDSGERSGVTDSQGMVNFANVLPRNYGLCEVEQAGWVRTKPQASNCQGVTLDPGGSIAFYFANFELGSVQGKKFEDVNNNGTRQGSEPYLNNWDIYLLDSQWNQLKTMKTGDDGTEAGNVETGQYRFINLGPGSYFVCEDKKQGWDQTMPSSGPMHGNSVCYSFSITSGQNPTGKTFGNFELGKVQGKKYYDADGDGNPHESGEAYLNGWTIRLYEDWEEPVEVTTSNTGELGQYRYSNLLPRTYQICEVLNEGWTQTWPKVGDVPVADNGTLHPEYGQAVVNQNSGQDEGEVCWQTVIDSSGDFNQLLRFGNTQFGSILVHKFEDNNNNGSINANEGGLEGWEMGVYNGSGCQGMVIQNGLQNTDSNGDAKFDNLLVGNYSVKETEQQGWQNTTPTCQDVAVTAGQQSTFNVGNFELGDLYVDKYEDTDGVLGRTAGQEYWIGDPTFYFRLYKVNGGSWSFVREQGTDSLGRATFTDVFDQLGDYAVCEVKKEGWEDMRSLFNPDNNLSGQPDEYPTCEGITVPGSGYGVYAEFGNIRLGNIHGYKWNDLNGNQDPDCNLVEDQLVCEEKLSGWTINLYRWNGEEYDSTPLRTMVTDNGSEHYGWYWFEDLLPGQYKVCEVLQGGWEQTYPINENENCHIVTLPDGNSYGFPVTVNVIAGPEYNFGNFQLGQITACKYEDLDGDGVKDENESGMMGVDLELQVKDGDGWNQDVILGQTGEDGCYTFANLGPGTYRVRENLKQEGLEGYTPTDGFTTEGDYRLTDEIIMTSNSDFTRDFINVAPAGLTLAKTNDKTGGASGGDIVTYTLTVTNDKRKLVNGMVMDIMPFGFTYVSGSGKINGASANPMVIGNILIWSLGDFGSSAVVTIEYQAKVPSGAKPCTYTNIAFASAKKYSGGPSIGSNLANSKVPIGQTLSISAGVGGTVLGVSTGEVLGAVLPAAGSNTEYLILALIFVAVGLIIKKFSRKSYEKDN